MTLAGFGQFWSELDSFRAEMFGFLKQYDVILSPVAAFPAVPHGTSTDDSIFPGFSYTMTYNMTGWPAAVIRFGTSPEGLPIGIQIATAPWREDLALSVAAALEAIYQAGDVPGPKAVIDIDDSHVA